MSETIEEQKKQIYCRNCGSSILVDSERCLLCGSYQLPGRLPFFKYLSESRLFRRVFLFPLAGLFAFTLPIFNIFYSIPYVDWTWIAIFSEFLVLFSVFGYISEWIFLNKVKGDAKDFRQGFFEWQKNLYSKNKFLSYMGMFLFVCVPLLDWANPILFALSSSAIWSLIVIFLSKILIPLF